MNNEQILFFNQLSDIQDYCVNVALINKDNYTNTEHLLNDVTSDVICRIMELLDGYYCNEFARCNLVSTKTNKVLNEGLELHDKCVEYLKQDL